jgi:hypothetical protein
MPYAYDDADNLEGKPLTGNHQCVALLQSYASAPHTSTWKEGKKVLGNLSLAKGTSIATFISGKYPNKSTGNHAALYPSQDGVASG